jgi:hypothetical protein
MMKHGGPAFPTSPSRFYVGDDGSIEPNVIFNGMSLRDWFAGQALGGICNDGDVFWEGAARLAYQYADAMLEEREK